jgi:hypothetical protein
VLAGVVAAIVAPGTGGGPGGQAVSTGPTVSAGSNAPSTPSSAVAPSPEALRQALLSTPFPSSLLPAGFAFCVSGSPWPWCNFQGGKLGPEANQNLLPVTPDNRYHFVGDAQIYFTRPGGSSQQVVLWGIRFFVFADAASVQAWQADNSRFFDLVPDGNVEIRLQWGTSDNLRYGAGQQAADRASLLKAAQTYLSDVRRTAR